MAYPQDGFGLTPLQSEKSRQNQWARSNKILAARAQLSTGEKKQITRNRASYSCKECRKRKIKCDKVHPSCGNCVKNQERCAYSTDSRSSSALPESSSSEAVRHRAKRRKQVEDAQDSLSEDDSPNNSATKNNPPRNVSLEDRLDRLTSLVEALSRGKSDEAAAHLDSEYGLHVEKGGKKRRDSLIPKNGNGNIDDLLYPLSPRNTRSRGATQSGNGNGADRSSRSPGYEFDVPTNMSGELEDPLSKLNLGYLSVQEGGRSCYAGSTWWAVVSDELDQLNVLLRDQNRYLSASHIGNRDCEDAEVEDSVFSPLSDISDSSMLPNSFQKAGDHDHHIKAQFRHDCSACRHMASEKVMLLQSLEVHPSKFAKVGADLVSKVPEERQSHVLYRCWLSGVHAYCPLVGLPTCLENYEEFWAWYNKGRLEGLPVPNTQFMPLLYAVWYAGSVSISLRGLRRFFPNTTRASLSASFHDQATRCLTLLNFPRNASYVSLSALLMIQVIPAKEEEPMTISLFVGLAIRAAQTLGLHREPSLFNLKPWEAEVRRRIFWSIYQLDVYVAITSGLPPMMNEEFFDTRMITELKDMHIGTKEGDDYERAVASGQKSPDNPDNPTARKWESMVDVHNLVARARYTTSVAVHRILHIHLGTKRITREDMLLMRKIIHRIDHDLNETIKRIPTKGIPEMGFTPDADGKGGSLAGDYDPESSKPPSQDEMRPFIGMSPREGLDDRTVRYHWNTLVAFHKFARIVLSLLIDKMYCVSFLPLLKNAKSRFWSFARQCALRSCHGYMRKFIALATDPAFQPFQWSWPGTHQPMHPTMIMLVDLHERPFSVEAPRSRAFIDKIFSMSTEDGGIVSGEDGVSVSRPLREGGREAWELLRKLREKAWQRAGLDPDILWTEESQISAGVTQPLTESQRQAQMLREDVIGLEPTRTSGQNASMISTEAGVQTLVRSAVNERQGAPDDPRPPYPARPTEQLLSAVGAPYLGHANLGSVDGPAVSGSGPASMPAPPFASVPHLQYCNPATAASSNACDTVTTLSQHTCADPGETLGALEPAQSRSAPVANAPEPGHDEDFWIKWDSILGSHAGYEDMTEDIKWDDIGNRNNDHDVMN